MTRIAVAQFRSCAEKSTNLRTAREWVAEAKKGHASIVAFPEFLMAYSPASQSAAELCDLAESIDGPFTSSLRDLAQALEISILATIYESSPIPQRVYDTALWIDGKGKITGVYRKVHLYDALGFKESDKFAAGDELAPPVKADFAQVGMVICYDLRFPEISRLLALSGAEVLVSPSGWVQGEMKVDHWQTMIRARALENGCYVVAPDQVGNIYIGHSMLVDPFGRTLIEMGGREGLAFADVDFTAVSEIREKLPLLKNRRPEIYRSYSLAAAAIVDLKKSDR